MTKIMEMCSRSLHLQNPLTILHIHGNFKFWNNGGGNKATVIKKMVAIKNDKGNGNVFMTNASTKPTDHSANQDQYIHKTH